MVADKDKDRSSSALHGMAEEEEEEESERKGRQVAAHGRSAKDEGGGDAADETSVNSTPGTDSLSSSGPLSPDGTFILPL